MRFRALKGLAVNWQEMLDGTVRGSFQHPALHRLGLPNFSGWESGRVWGEWDVDPEICNPDGALFGGYLAALADATAGHAVATTCTSPITVRCGVAACDSRASSLAGADRSDMSR